MTHPQRHLNLRGMSYVLITLSLIRATVKSTKCNAIIPDLEGCDYSLLWRTLDSIFRVILVLLNNVLFPFSVCFSWLIKKTLIKGVTVHSYDACSKASEQSFLHVVPGIYFSKVILFVCCFSAADDPATRDKGSYLGLLKRACRTAIPIQLMMLLLIGVASLVPMCENECVLNSLDPILKYADGSPPLWDASWGRLAGFIATYNCRTNSYCFN